MSYFYDMNESRLTKEELIKKAKKIELQKNLNDLKKDIFADKFYSILIGISCGIIPITYFSDEKLINLGNIQPIKELIFTLGVPAAIAIISYLVISPDIENKKIKKNQIENEIKEIIENEEFTSYSDSDEIKEVKTSSINEIKR